MKLATLEISCRSEVNCSICRPLPLNKEVFQQIHCLHDTVPHETNERHFQKFGNLSSTKTKESCLPLVNAKELHKNTMRFNVNNIETTLT